MDVDSRLQEVPDAHSHVLRVVGEPRAYGLLVGEEGASGCWGQGAQGLGEYGGVEQGAWDGGGEHRGWRGALGGRWYRSMIWILVLFLPLASYAPSGVFSCVS